MFCQGKEVKRNGVGATEGDAAWLLIEDSTEASSMAKANTAAHEAESDVLQFTLLRAQICHRRKFNGALQLPANLTFDTMIHFREKSIW